MAEERRNDIGSKVTIGVTILVVAGLLSVAFQHTYTMSYQATEKANKNEVVNAAQSKSISYMEDGIDDLKTGQNEIKSLLMQHD